MKKKLNTQIIHICFTTCSFVQKRNIMSIDFSGKLAFVVSLFKFRKKIRTCCAKAHYMPLLPFLPHTVASLTKKSEYGFCILYSFVVRVLNTPKGSATLSLVPSLHNTTAITIPSLADPCLDGVICRLNLRPALSLWNCLAIMWLLPKPGLCFVFLWSCSPCSGTARLHPGWGTGPPCLRGSGIWFSSHSSPALLFLYVYVCWFCLFVFFFSFFCFNIIIIQQVASPLKLKGQFMEIGLPLFPIQQLSVKLIRYLLTKVFLIGMLICIWSLITDQQ